jgi:hypothetical protein
MKPPRFLGQPSPALKKMQKMSPAELQEYIARLNEERQRIATKLEGRKKANAPTEHDWAAEKLAKRLDALIDMARRYWKVQGGTGPEANPALAPSVNPSPISRGYNRRPE